MHSPKLGCATFGYSVVDVVFLSTEEEMIDVVDTGTVITLVQDKEPIWDSSPMDQPRSNVGFVPFGMGAKTPVTIGTATTLLGPARVWFSRSKEAVKGFGKCHFTRSQAFACFGRMLALFANCLATVFFVAMTVEI